MRRGALQALCRNDCRARRHPRALRIGMETLKWCKETVRLTTTNTPWAAPTNGGYSGAHRGTRTLASFAISVLWDTTGYVCVQETNQEGCMSATPFASTSLSLTMCGVSVKWLVHPMFAWHTPTLPSDQMTVRVPSRTGLGRSLHSSLTPLVHRLRAGRFDDSKHDVLDVRGHACRAIPAQVQIWRRHVLPSFHVGR